MAKRQSRKVPEWTDGPVSETLLPAEEIAAAHEQTFQQGLARFLNRIIKEPPTVHEDLIGDFVQSQIDSMADLFLSTYQYNATVRQWATGFNVLRARLVSELFDHRPEWSAYRGKVEIQIDAKIAHWKNEAMGHKRDPVARTRELLKRGPRHTNARKEFILRLLKQRNWSLFDFSDESGIDPKTIRSFLDCKGTPIRRTVEEIAQTLEISVNQIPPCDQ